MGELFTTAGPPAAKLHNAPVRGLLPTLLVAAATALGAAGAEARDWRDHPVVPKLGPAVQAHAERIATRGEALGSRAGVFAKVGDSITESASFLQDLACQPPRWGEWRRLRATWRYFGRTRLAEDSGGAWCGVPNSYSRASRAAVAGWTASDALHPLVAPPPGCEGIAAVECELRLLQPSVALVMFGTNDLEQMSAGAFRRDLARLTRVISAAGTIPVISTIPPRPGARFGRRSERFNEQIAGLARNRALPLWNYWRQVTAPGVPRMGLSRDWVHPSLRCPPCAGGDFTAAGLRQGYPLRNLGALLALDRLRRRVLSP